jgi:hypothetical protein
MAYIYISRNDETDPSYFQVQEWLQQLPAAMNEVNDEFDNEVLLTSEWNDNPIVFQVRNPMMDTTGYHTVADKLFQYSQYQYSVEN